MATSEILKKRALLLRSLRSFFYRHNILECDVSCIGYATVTDPFIDSINLNIKSQTYYLQSSPEFFLKRLLADGVGSCFYLGKAFREGELGKNHNPEFTLCEWYCIDYNDNALIQQVIDLIIHLVEIFHLPKPRIKKVSYGDIFYTHTGINPYSATIDELKYFAKKNMSIHFDDEHINTWLDCIFTHIVEPQLNELTVVYDYPISQCALARLAENARGEMVAKRFEVFWQKKELANGYWELTCAEEQKKRFNQDNLMRASVGKKPIEHDKKMLAALQSGLPDCAGVALGVDRLLMCLLGKHHINDVMPFGFEQL